MTTTTSTRQQQHRSNPLLFPHHPQLLRHWKRIFELYSIVNNNNNQHLAFSSFVSKKKHRQQQKQQRQQSLRSNLDDVNSFFYPPSPFVYHVLIDAANAPIPLLDAIQKVLTGELPSSRVSSKSSSLSLSSKSNEGERFHNDNNNSNDSHEIPQDPMAILSPRQLLHMGAVYFMSSGPSNAAAVKLARSKGIKPIRLRLDKDATRILQSGDYLRIHHSPRRFPAVYDYDWGAMVKTNASTTDSSDGEDGSRKPGVLVRVDDDKGYIVLDKPASVPVHPTVDNIIENVPYFIRQARMTNAMAVAASRTQPKIPSGNVYNNEDNPFYVTTPQRLDQNTSGLMVVATKKSFAAYLAKLLREKTDRQLEIQNQQQQHPPQPHDDDDDDCNSTQLDQSHRRVHKKYRCLICLMQPTNNMEQGATENYVQETVPWSINGTIHRLEQLVNTQSIIRHYSEPTIGAPKKFVRILPENETWAECLLRITNVGRAIQVGGADPASRQLALQLWGDLQRVPPDCVGIVELEVELLTGRTHQIRGQLSAEGFPLVGDAQYGGSIPSLEGNCSHVSPDTHYMISERLALQCCELAFVDPDFCIIQRNDNDDDDHENQRHRPQQQAEDDETQQEQQVPSDRWNSFRLEEAWWTPILSRFLSTPAANLSENTLSAATNGISEQATSTSRVELLPPRVQLSVGRNKYVLVKAVANPTSQTEMDATRQFPDDNTNNNSNDVYWFVKSATVQECGGPYHADVARELVECIQAAGFKAIVTGGGRIDYYYNTDSPTPAFARVYGFSYGFGKGDHAMAAALIRQESGNAIQATFDDSNDLY